MSYILFVFAAVFALLSLEGCRYEFQGERVMGVVLRKEPRPNVKSKNHLRYRFTARDGRTLEGRSEVLPQRFQELSEGGPVEVEYIGSSPGTNRVAGQRAGSLVFGLMSAGTLAGGVALRRRERRRKSA